MDPLMMTSALPPDEVLDEMQTLVAIGTYSCGSRSRNDLQLRSLVTFRKRTSGGQGPPFSNEADLFRWLYEHKRHTWKTYVKLKSGTSINGAHPTVAPPTAPETMTTVNPLSAGTIPISQGIVTQKVCALLITSRVAKENKYKKSEII